MGGWLGWGGLGMPSLANGEGAWDWTFLFFQTMFCATAAKTELKGLDMVEHGQDAYASFQFFSNT